MSEKPTILMIEDSEDFLYPIRQILRRKCIVECAYTVEEAEQIYRTRGKEFNLISFDACMPRRTGEDFSRVEPATLDLLREVLASGYKGICVALSANLNQVLVNNGCPYKCEKADFPQFVSAHLLKTA